MPKANDSQPIVSRKRKRNTFTLSAGSSNPEQLPYEVDRLEHEVLQSQKHLNNIARLYEISCVEFEYDQFPAPATTALCRIFSRFLTEGRCTFSKISSSDRQDVIKRWLNQRLSEYRYLLLNHLRDGASHQQELGLTLSMELISRDLQTKQFQEKPSQESLYGHLMSTMLGLASGDFICRRYADLYGRKFEDLRSYTFAYVHNALIDDSSFENQSILTKNALRLLSAVSRRDLHSEQERTNFSLSEVITDQSQMKCAQLAWTKLMSRDLTKAQRKTILENMTKSIVPWFRKCELLMDFLGDSLQVGGATSLLSLSGLFHLMRERNLDFPDFFTKLYSMLDSHLLHSKHRSGFFRLLSVFMSSTHLPSALVASFIKKLSRLALNGPPAAIVTILPWIYNMLRAHVACTFMLHRQPRCDEEKQLLALEGAIDPFDTEETDPMNTQALESSLWELVTLQSHYHPNIAALAHILSDQFTKQSYELEHFLDYSYAALIDAELTKDLKKAPIVEYQIPRHVFAVSDEAGSASTVKTLM